MSLASHLRVPELVAGLDVRALPLSALEGFVLSRIDGRSTTGDIVSLTGLPLEQVLGILEKLVSLGAARFRDQPAFDPPTGSKERAAPGVHPSQPPPRKRLSHAPGAHPPRRMMSESAISSPPPEALAHSSRPRKLSEPPAPPSRSHAMPARTVTIPPVAAPALSPEPRSLSQPPPQRSIPPSGLHQPVPSSLAQPPLGGHSAGPINLPQTNVDAPLSHVSLEPAPIVPALYDPRELDEDVDFPRERRKQLLDLFYALSELDYYEALGIPYTAEKKDIRSAYFGLSKQFHPDTFFRKNLGSFKAKMEAVFKYLTEGYEVLGKKKTRDEYDAYLRSTKAARMAERALTFQAAVPDDPMKVPPPPLVPNIPVPAHPPSSQPAPATVAPAAREVSAEARKLAQEVIARRLRGIAPPRTQAPSPSTVLPTQAAEPPPAQAKSALPEAKGSDPQAILARLTRTLRDAGQLTGSNDRITRAMRASQAAVERGDLAEATQQAARAASLAPERTELKAEHSRLTTLLSERLANDYIEQAKFEMKQGKWASAALTWSKVCDGRPTDAAAHRFAAQALLKGGGELRGAQKYAQKAVFLAPSDIEARILLSQIYLTVGLKLNARRELDAAAKLDPANEMVKNLLADLEKG